MIEVCSLFSFSTTLAASESSELTNSAKEVIDELDLVVLGLRSFCPPASYCCDAVLVWWLPSLSGGSRYLKRGSMPCLGIILDHVYDVRFVYDDFNIYCV